MSRRTLDLKKNIETDKGEILVSTVQLFDEENFETRIFWGEGDKCVETYKEESEAMRKHKKYCKAIEKERMQRKDGDIIVHE